MKNKKNKKLSSLKAGLPPGNLEYRGDIYTSNKSVTLFSFNEIEFDKIHADSVDLVLNKVNSQKINWINLVGLHNTGLISKIGQHFNIHPLVLEDVLNTEHRPKAEETEDYLFFTLKMFKCKCESSVNKITQYIGKFVIIF